MKRLFVRQGTGEAASVRQWMARIPVRKELEVELVEVEADSIASSSEISATFRPALYMHHLCTKGMRSAGRRIVYEPRVSSTQTLLTEQFHGWDGWRLAAVCDVQTQGKGRGANQWESPTGCLMVSFQVVTRRGEQLPMLQYLVSLAVVQAVRRLGSAAVRIKWPNDLYAEGLKIGGVLCQSSYWKGDFVVTVGLGLNVANQRPTKCVNDLVPVPVTREAVLAEFFNCWEPLWDRFEREGFEPMRAEYEGAWMHQGQRLKLENDGGALVVVQGLSKQGFLIAREESSGRIVELEPDYNSLDWFQGLLRRKQQPLL